MPRTLTIDSLRSLRLHFTRSDQGTLHVLAEYHLFAGSQLVHTVQKDLTGLVSPTRAAAIRTVFDTIEQELTAQELA